ncbi:MAG TPA: MFS transporter, partial [Rhodopila sp.]|nr:MFS transporter [Rhodopila sp.]
MLVGAKWTTPRSPRRHCVATARPDHSQCGAALHAGHFSSSFDEITWVLTSYITASAIMTAPVGWLAARYGRKPLYVGCILGFTMTSMLCGAAQSLAQIV